VDDLDFRILAAIFGERLWRFTDWDPRISTRKIAARAGVAPSTVYERLSNWQASGFLQGYGVLPNPRLLGGRFVGHNVRLADPSAREAFVGAAERIEGVFSFFHHANAWVSVMTFAQSAEASWRQSEQVSRLEGGEHVEPPHVLPEIPPRGRNPDLLDWRIVKALAGWSGHSLVPVAEGAVAPEVLSQLERQFDRVERDLRAELRPTVDAMRATATFFAPVVLGVSGALYGLLSEAFATIASLPMSPPTFHVAVAVYLVLATAGILHFTSRLEGAGDPLALGDALSRALPIGFGTYVATLALAQLAL